uniref:Uncharacterized protein n=1 Tax=Zea mays TaxID=4577 RepID=C4IYD0_MAIZE|nr:unknown [Zea mays]
MLSMWTMEHHSQAPDYLLRLCRSYQPCSKSRLDVRGQTLIERISGALRGDGASGNLKLSNGYRSANSSPVNCSWRQNFVASTFQLCSLASSMRFVNMTTLLFFFE